MADYADAKDVAPPKGKRMPDEEFRSYIGELIVSAAAYGEELSTDRATATRYYKGEPFGNEEEGRSQIVLTELRDAVLGVLPSLVRVILGPDYPVEFTPKRGDEVEQAAQATEYIRYVFLEDNPGFMNTISVLKDGLIRKIGIFKWGWDDAETASGYRLEGVTAEELRGLAADESVTVVSIEKQEPEDAPSDSPVQPLPEQENNPTEAATPDVLDDAALYDVEVRHVNTEGRARIWSIPTDEFIWNREARDLDTALFVGHQTEKTRGELIAMGISEKLIEEHAGGDAGDNALRNSPEEIARRGQFAASNDPNAGEANYKIKYVEGYALIDFDGDGTAELRKVCTIGPGNFPVWNKPASERPFAIFCPDPEPHTLLGQSWFDRLRDIQKGKSMLLRGGFDSLSASIFPRMTYEEGYASVADMLNTAIGAPIRIRKTGAVQSFAHPFVGREVVPFLDLFSDMKEQRIGRNNGAGGLDMDALQSTEKTGVQAAIAGSQEQAELIARIFAEGCFKPMFRGLYRLYVEHKPKKRIVRLRGKWVEVDPASWNADMDVSVNVALGAGFTEKKIQTLVAIAQKQQEILEKFGPTNPLVTIAMWRDTVAKITVLQGMRDAESYFKPVDPNWQPPPAPTPPPTPEQVIAQSNLEVEKLKVTRSLAEKKDELALKEKQIDLDHEIKIRQMAQDFEIKKYQIDMQFQTGKTNAQLTADVNREVAETKMTIEAHDQLHDQGLEIAQHEHDKAMDLRAADTADAAAAAAPVGAAE